ncbi:hypothetical protein ACI65C_004410 [Semiaphis heraclei]
MANLCHAFHMAQALFPVVPELDGEGPQPTLLPVFGNRRTLFECAYCDRFRAQLGRPTLELLPADLIEKSAVLREAEEGSLQAVLRNGRRHPVRKREEEERAGQTAIARAFDD